MFFNSERKLENPERIHACTGRTYKLPAEKPQVGFEQGTFLL